MNQRQQILQVLFENKVFEGNISELARTLGYSEKSHSRSTINRIKNSEVVLTDRKIDDIYTKIKEEYQIDDDDFITIAKSVEYGKSLYRLLREANGIDENWYNTAFDAIVTENYSAVPQMSERLTNELQEMKLQEPEIYFATLAYLYIIYKGISPYTVKGRKTLSKQLNDLNTLLYKLYPGSSRSYEATKESIKISLAEEHQSILGYIYNLRHIIRGYVDNAYFESFLREMGILFDVGEDSFWIVPDDTFREGCILWFLSVIPTKSIHHGAYTAMKLQARSSAIDSFELIEAYNIMFIINATYDNFPLMQAYEICTGKIEYAQFNYNTETRRLELTFDDSLPATFNLPPVLKCLNLDNPKGKDEKIWANIANKLSDDRRRKFILTAINSSSNSNFEYLSEYDVSNVSIDRMNLTVTIENKDEEKSYSIPTDTYTFFEQLTPSEFASVVRYKDTGELAIAWNDLGQTVPLQEFIEKE